MENTLKYLIAVQWLFLEWHIETTINQLSGWLRELSFKWNQIDLDIYFPIEFHKMEMRIYACQMKLW